MSVSIWMVVGSYKETEPNVGKGVPGMWTVNGTLRLKCHNTCQLRASSSSSAMQWDES